MKTAYLLSSAMLLALAAPAFAQTAINQTTTGDIYQGSYFDGPGIGGIGGLGGNDVTIVGSGNVTAFAGQTANNTTNAIGPQAYVAVSDPYTIQQGAGNYNTGTVGEPNYTGGSVSQGAFNNITAIGTAGTANNVTAGGFQSGSNQINVANIAPVTGSTGTLVQAAGDTTQDAFNNMLAQNNGTGSASIIGSNGNGGAGYQSAFGSLNTATVFVTGGAVATNQTPATYGTSLDAQQKLAGSNEISAVNSAVANTTATTGSTTIDPSISNLNQASQISVNQLGFQTQGTTTGTGSSAVTTYAAGNVALSGGQGLPTAIEGDNNNNFNNGVLSVTLGNTAVSYTGAAGGVEAGYGLIGGLGVGAAQVSGVTQYASLSLNGISGGANTSINLAGTGAGMDGFTQSVSGETQQINTPYGNGGGVFGDGGFGIVNGMGALTGSGNATITGAAFTPGNYTQAANIQQNSISTGGSLSGIATQNATDIASGNNDGIGLGYSNVAAAYTGNGSASLKNVSQYMGQSLNTVSANGTSTGLTLNQNAGGNANDNAGIYLAGNNAQFASGTTGSSITGGVQVVSNSVNVASLGGISGNINQNANNVGTSANNIMATSFGGGAFNTSASGSQSTSSQINVIK